MNISTVITRIKLKLGLLNITTPIEDLDGTIMMILKDITLPVFSIYAPRNEVYRVSLNDVELIEKTDSCKKFLLPDFFTNKIIEVTNVEYDESFITGMGYYGGGMPFMQGSLTEQLMLANAGASAMNMIVPKLTFKFEPPRTLSVYNAYVSSTIKISIAFEHDKSFATIPETARESFIKLATLDVKENLYPTLKHYSEINTAIGNINLKIDDWANAESERNDLINSWDDSYHLDRQPFYWQ